jgi:hypothetical protein
MATPTTPAGCVDAESAADQQDAARVANFLQQAQWVLADQRGMTVKAQMMIAAIARDLGVSEEQAADAIRSLQQSNTSENGTGSGARMPGACPTFGDPPCPPPRSGVVGIEPPPVAEPAGPPSESPPRQPATPQLMFRAYLGEALAKSSREEISARKEHRLIEEGTRKLGLAEVFARQILFDVAAAMGKRLASAADSGGIPASEPAGDLPAEAIGEFLERAAAILTEQRGMNARSRVLLAAVASSCGLNQAQMERAMQLLQGEGYDPQAADARQAEREQAFRNALLDSFRQLPHRLLHARDERRWLEDGNLRYGLPTERAADLIGESAAQAGVRVISADKASGHVYALAADLLDQGYRLERAIRTRIVVEGGQWGLTEDQVDAILQDAMLDRQHADSTHRRLMVLALGGGAGLLGALLLMLTWMVFFSRDAASTSGHPETVQAAADEATAAVVPSGREWWTSHEELLIAATKVRIVMPDVKGDLARLGSTEAELRGTAYRDLVAAVVPQTDLRVHGLLLRDFFAGCLALDPSDDAAGALAGSLLDRIPKLGARLPPGDDAAGFDLSFWAVRCMLDVFAQPGLSDRRGDQLAALLGTALGIRIQRSLDRRELERQCMVALCQHLYSVIITAATSQPHEAAALFTAVTRQASRYLDSAAVDQRTADLLTAVFPGAEKQWREYEYLLQFALNSNEPLVVLRIVDLYEQISDPDFQAFLAERLLRRARIVARTVPRDEVPQRVREALGVKSPVSGRQRWKQLTGLIDERPVAGAEQPVVERLQSLSDIAHAGTLACALGRGESGYATFDELFAAGPVALSSSGTAPARGRDPATPRRVPSSLVQSVLVNIANLSDTRNRSRGSAPLYLRNVATIAPQVPDLPREPAEQLARYLLSGKTDAEHQAVLQHAHTVTRWSNVRLALADQVLETNTNRQRVVEVLAGVLGRDVGVDDDTKWRQRLRDSLLLDVIQALAFAAPPAHGSERIYDDLADVLRETYTTRARLSGVPSDQYASAATATDVLRLMIETNATRTGRNPGSGGAAGGSIADWAEQLAAIDYVAENDLQKTVLLQRLWLRGLAARMTHSGEIPAGEGTRLLAELTDADRQAVDLIQQLADGERTHQQLWLLRRSEP